LVVDTPSAPAPRGDLDRLARTDDVLPRDSEVHGTVDPLRRSHIGAASVERRNAFEARPHTKASRPAPAGLARDLQTEAALEDPEPRLLRGLPGRTPRGHLFAREHGIIARGDLDPPGDLALTLHGV